MSPPKFDQDSNHHCPPPGITWSVFLVFPGCHISLSPQNRCFGPRKQSICHSTHSELLFDSACHASKVLSKPNSQTFFLFFAYLLKNQICSDKVVAKDPDQVLSAFYLVVFCIDTYEKHSLMMGHIGSWIKILFSITAKTTFFFLDDKTPPSRMMRIYGFF